MELNNLDKLADQIYQEGISKAKTDSQKIMEDAEAKAASIIQEAKKEAERIKKAAEKEASRSKEKAQNEIRLAGKQAISQLQATIRSLLSDQLVGKTLSTSIEDQAFLEKLIFEIVSKWSPDAGVEVTLSGQLSSELREDLKSKVASKLTGIELKVSDSLQKGFVVESSKDGYFIAFTEDDLRIFLEEYLSSDLQSLLFE
jgi:V/A-type H+-transporting ATPase subunit E